MAGSNDNHGPNRPLGDAPDAHGQAAFLMVESLLHVLREQRVLSTSQAIEVVTVAADVEHDIAAVSGDPPEHLRRSLALLGQVLVSLRADEPR